MKFYTYVHFRLDSLDVFYVGKGKGKRALDFKNRGVHWKRIHDKHGVSVEIVEEFEVEADAYENEKLLISILRMAGHPLINRTDGGEGLLNPSDDVRAKLAASARKYAPILKDSRSNRMKALWSNPELRAAYAEASAKARRTPEYRKSASEARKGNVFHDADRRKKISDRTKEAYADVAVRKKLSDALKLAASTPEAKAKRSAASKAKMTPEARKKHSETIRIKWEDPEFRARVAIAQKLAWEKRRKRDCNAN